MVIIFFIQTDRHHHRPTRDEWKTNDVFSLIFACLKQIYRLELILHTTERHTPHFFWIQ